MNLIDGDKSSLFSSRLVLSLLLLGVVAVWGWTFTLVKQAIAEFGAVPFLAVRFVIAAVVMAMIMFLEPLFAALFGFVAGDRLTLLQLAGGAVMLAAFAVVEVYPRWAGRRRRP